MEKIQFKIRFFDLLFSFCILALLFLIPYWVLHKDNTGSEEIKIFKEDKLVVTAQLDVDRLITVGKMVIEIKDGKVRVKDTDCPKQLCKSFGWVKSPGQSIVCVANKVVIEVYGKSKDADYVAMSY